MKIHKLIVIVPLLVVMAIQALVIVPHATLAANQNQDHCNPSYIEKDENAPFEYNGNQIITWATVKAGSTQSGGGCFFYNQNGSDGCYEITGLGTTHVTVTKVGSGPNCKDISHVEFCADSVTASPSATPNASPSASPVASSRVSPDTSASPSTSSSPTPSTSSGPSATPDASTDQNTGGGKTDSSTSTSNSPSVQSAVAEAKPGDVLGTTTLASTGMFREQMGQAILLMGIFMTILSVYGYRRATSLEAI